MSAFERKFVGVLNHPCGRVHSFHGLGSLQRDLSLPALNAQKGESRPKPFTPSAVCRGPADYVWICRSMSAVSREREREKERERERKRVLLGV